MTKVLVLTNGVPVMTDIAVSGSPATDDRLLVVLGAPGNANEITGPIVAGTPITLPNSLDYESGELEVTLNGQTILPVTGWNEIGSGTKTQISFNQDLDIDDEIGFRRD